MFFCLAVNMLPPENLEELLSVADEVFGGNGAKEKVAYTEKKLYDCAEVLGIEKTET